MRPVGAVVRDQGEGLRSAAKLAVEFPDMSGGVTPGARVRTERVVGVRVLVKWIAQISLRIRGFKVQPPAGAAGCIPSDA